jgi:hypothetical protein
METIGSLSPLFNKTMKSHYYGNVRPALRHNILIFSPQSSCYPFSKYALIHYAILYKMLYSYDWSCIYKQSSVDSAVNGLNSVVVNSVSQAVPYRCTINFNLRLQVLTAASIPPDDGGSTHLWNAGQIQPDYTALHPRRLYTVYSQIFHAAFQVLWNIAFIREVTSFVVIKKLNPLHIILLHILISL